MAIPTFDMYRLAPEMYHHQGNRRRYAPVGAPEWMRPPPPPSPATFLTDRMEHARFVLSKIIQPMSTPGRRLHELPITVLPPFPKQDIPYTLKDVKDLKEGMFQQFTAAYWKRALRKIRIERGEDSGETEEVDDGTTRYRRGFVYRGVYSRYSQGILYRILVPEGAMESILDLMPQGILAFHPRLKYSSSMELSLTGLSRSIFLARENAAACCQILRGVIRFLTAPAGTYDYDVRKALVTLGQFLEQQVPKLNVLSDLTIAFLKAQGEDPIKLSVLELCRHAFHKTVERVKYVTFIVKMDQAFDSNVARVAWDLSLFQDALNSIEEWRRW